MARPLRLEFPDAIYHVTARGKARNAVFLDDKIESCFFVCLGEVVVRFGWLCHAYCLMDNHYHLLIIESPEGNLSLGMRQLNGFYIQRFNRRHGRVGHLSQGRFKAIVVDPWPEGTSPFSPFAGAQPNKGERFNGVKLLV